MTSISCTPRQEGVDALFGEGASQGAGAFLSLAAPQGAPSQGEVRFALDAPSAIDDPTALAPFAMDGGYGTKLQVSYGIVLAEGAAIPMDYPLRLTSVADVAYTVGLARKEAQP